MIFIQDWRLELRLPYAENDGLRVQTTQLILFKKVGDHLFDCGYEYFFVEEKNYKKEKLSSNFLLEISKYIGKNKSSTNILIL